MEIILSVIFIIGFWAFFKIQEGRAINHSNAYKVDWRKANDDRLMNDLSNSEVNQNIINGKYDSGEKNKTGVQIRAEQDAFWEQYKKDNPWMPLN